MDVKWRIKFRSLRTNTLYTLSIYTETWSGDPIELKGGAQPFTTDEGSDDDQFTPVRTSTGYFRIVDDGKDANGNAFNWESLIPETDISHPVVLEGTGRPAWVGYMQAQDFGNVLYGNPQEREFPVQCALSALNATEIGVAQKNIRNFASLIYQAFSSLSGIPGLSYRFQGGGSAREWLMKMVDVQNLVQNDEDGLSARYDNLQLVRDICQYWGWTCRLNGTVVCFTRSDDRVLTNSLTLTAANLATIAGGTSAGTISNNFFTARTLRGDIFASVNNHEYLVRGYSKATVKANGNAADVAVMRFAPSPLEKEMSGRSGYQEQDDDGRVRYTGDLLEFNTSFLTGSCRSSYATFNRAEIWKNSSPMESVGTNDVIRIRKSGVSVGNAYASLTTVFEHSFYDTTGTTFFWNNGGITIHGEIYRKSTKYEDYADSDGIGKKTMYMRLGIGATRGTALWWDGNIWSSTESAFEVTIGNDGDILYGKYVAGGHGSVTLYKYIPTNNVGLWGLVFVEFLGSDNMPEVSGERMFDIANFSLEFVRGTISSGSGIYSLSNGNGNFGGSRSYSKVERVDTREYSAKNQNKARQDWNADLIFASDNDMTAGYGVVLNADRTPMGALTYNLENLFPEQHLANRVASYWSGAKRKLDMELRTDAVSPITPQNLITVGNTNYHPIGISNNWRDDVVRLTLLEQ